MREGCASSNFKGVRFMGTSGGKQVIASIQDEITKVTSIINSGLVSGADVSKQRRQLAGLEKDLADELARDERARADEAHRAAGAIQRAAATIAAAVVAELNGKLEGYGVDE